MKYSRYPRKKSRRFSLFLLLSVRSRGNESRTTETFYNRPQHTERTSAIKIKQNEPKTTINTPTNNKQLQRITTDYNQPIKNQNDSIQSTTNHNQPQQRTTKNDQQHNPNSRNSYIVYFTFLTRKCFPQRGSRYFAQQ